MKTVTLALLVVLASAVFGFADVCQTTSYDKYLGPGFACGILDKNFFNFSYSTDGNPVGMPPESITVSPLDTPSNPGFLFNANWFVGPRQDQGSTIGFTVTSSGAPITALSLQIFGYGFTGAAGVGVLETYCLGDTFADSCLLGTMGELSVIEDYKEQKDRDSVSFAGVSVVDVIDNIGLEGAISGGGAHLGGVQNNFSETPEPSSIILFGTGILGLAGVLRRKL